MKKVIESRSLHAIAVSTIILIVSLVLIVSVAGVSMYTIYTQSEKQKSIVEYCRQQGGVIKFSTSGGYSGMLKPVKNMWQILPSTQNTTQLSCHPSGTSYITYPNGQTLIASNPGTEIQSQNKLLE